MRKITFGIRKSRLAQAQLDEFIRHLDVYKSDLEYEVKHIVTKGDSDKVTPIEDLGQGVFIKELEQQILANEIDCAVHSLKDMPVSIAEGTVLACFIPRSDPRDCLVFRDDFEPDNLGAKKIATSSPRRQVFLCEIHDELKVVPVRGNIDTRLAKLDNGDFDAIVLAACGLKRLGLVSRISKYLDPEVFVPAAGQGIVCAQIRANDEVLLNILKEVSCKETEIAAISERRILKEFEVGCRKPFGVFARMVENEFLITAKMLDEKKGVVSFCRHVGPKDNYEIVTEEFIVLLNKVLESKLK